ncbi:cytochrome P450|uniref:cytochrome P450 n=1 Tax=Noviherbaspirillum sp. L7-7A TaxID=2850560 RepID=UPI001C2BA0B5|nr:cytochrome P450 [Noviherbaspirillum sp. L7-7A]
MGARPFGTDINTSESEGPVVQGNLGDIFRMLQKRLFAPLPYWHWIKQAEDHRLDENNRIVSESVQEFIRLARDRMNNSPALFDQPSNLLEAMIAARDENESIFLDSELAGNIVTLLLAGENTTAHSLAWFIYLAHQSPDVLLRIREEVDRIIGKDAVSTRHEQLGELDFIEACINESMRLRPSAPLVGVEANHDTVVADVAIPKGTMILLLTRVGALKEMHFANPCAFRPDRWMTSVSESIHRKACMPFGAGPRLCPGRFLAIEEMKMVITILVKNFDISALDTPDGKSVQKRLTFTMAPVGLQLKLRRR